jgi:signal transduction histidine kinase
MLMTFVLTGCNYFPTWKKHENRTAASTNYLRHENVSTDSLERILLTGNVSTAEKLAIYDELSWTYLETDIERATELARRGLSLAKAQAEWFFTGHFYSHLGFSHYYNSRFDSAMMYFELMLKTAENMKLENPDKADELEADAYTNIGVTYDAQGKLMETVNCYLKGLDIAERKNLTNTRELLYANLGRVYFCLKNNDKALYFYQKDLELCRMLNDSSKMCYAFLGLGDILLERYQYDSALMYATQAHRLAMNHPNATVEIKIYSLQTLAEIHIKGNIDNHKAMEYAGEAFRYAEQWNSPVHRANSLRQMSLVSLKQGEYAAAEQLALQALANDSTDLYANALLNEYIAKANICMGNKDRALAAFDRQIRLNSIYSNKNYHVALTEMEVKYETEKKELQILAVEEEKQVILWMGIAGITILFLGLSTLFFLWRLTVQKRRLAENKLRQLEQEKQLVATQAVLDGETQERTRLARDLHDGLGGMLTGVKLNLECMKNGVFLNPTDLKNFNNAMTILNESMVELRRVAHHLMPETLSRFGLKPAIGDFCRSISPIIVFDWFGDSDRLDTKLEIVVYRIVHELVNNALKYANASQIIVQIMQEYDRIAFIVQDDGCGFDVLNETAGMGLSNIRTRVASFDGIIQIDSKPDEGTEIHVELKVKN